MADEHYRPYLTAALFCEKVLQETDGVLSLIRVLDQVTCTGTTPEMPQIPIPLNLVIAFKSGFVQGKYVVQVRPNSPSGKAFPTIDMPAFFEGNDRGVNLIGAMNFVVEEEGIYWFDILFQGELFTRIPLRVLYQRVVGG